MGYKRSLLKEAFFGHPLNTAEFRNDTLIAQGFLGLIGATAGAWLGLKAGLSLIEPSDVKTENFVIADSFDIDGKPYFILDSYKHFAPDNYSLKPWAPKDVGELEPGQSVKVTGHFTVEAIQLPEYTLADSLLQTVIAVPSAALGATVLGASGFAMPGFTGALSFRRREAAYGRLGR